MLKVLSKKCELQRIYGGIYTRGDEEYSALGIPFLPDTLWMKSLLSGAFQSGKQGVKGVNSENDTVTNEKICSVLTRQVSVKSQ